MSDDETKYPPFITPRSPSYQRAEVSSEEDLTRKARSEQQALDSLYELREAERHASEVCASMSTLLEDGELAQVVRDRGELHEARRRGIGKLIERMGAAPTAAEPRTVLARTREAMAHASSDSDAKQSLALLHEELSAHYEAALANDGLDEQQRSALLSFAPSQPFE